MTEKFFIKTIPVFLINSATANKHVFLFMKRPIIFYPNKMSCFVQIQQYTVFVMITNRATFHYTWNFRHVHYITKSKVQAKVFIKKSCIFVGIMVISSRAFGFL